MTEPKRKAISIPKQPVLVPNRFPSFLSGDQFRYLAREPVNHSYMQYLCRSLKQPWKFVPRPGEDENDLDVKWLIKYFTELFEEYNWPLVKQQWELDSYSLPFGGAIEISWDTNGLPNGFWACDGATFFVNQDRRYPYVQIDPNDWSRAIAFRVKDIMRLIVEPCTDMRRAGYQISPTESNYQTINMLALLYKMDMSLVQESPPPGILDLADFVEADAKTWADGFEELMRDPTALRIPILYEHEKPARFIPLTQPKEFKDQWRHYTEAAGRPYGLGLSAIQSYEHDRTLAGARIQRLTTKREGVASFAFDEQWAVNRQMLKGLPVQYCIDQPEIEDALKREQARGLRVAYLSTAVKTGAMQPEDMTEQMISDDVITIKPTPGAIVPGLQKPPGIQTGNLRGEYPEYPGPMLQSEAARAAARVVMKSLLIEESPAFEDMQKTLEEQLLSKKKSDKRRRGIARVVQRANRR